MAKRQLADLVGEELARPAPVEITRAEPEVDQAPGVPATRSSEPASVPREPERRPAAVGTPRTSKQSSASRALKPVPPKPVRDREEELAALPKYLRLVRKEARLREDQVLDLDRLVLRLNRRRRGGEGERITLNTLLRLGADLVLDRAAELSGETEEELSRSLGR